MHIPTHSRYLTARGNAGDALIAAALAPMLAAAEVAADGPVLYKPGGLSHFPNLLDPLRALPRDTRIIVLPSSIDDRVARFLKEFPNLHLHCRGRESLAIARRHGISCGLAHDVALAADVSRWRREGDGVLHCFRTDAESATNFRPEDNDDISMAEQDCWTPENCGPAADRFLSTIAGYAEVQTDRLHVAIAAVLLGKKVVLYTGMDHKIREVHAFSLAGFTNIELRDAAVLNRGPAPKAAVIHQSGKPERYPAGLIAAVGNVRMQEALCPAWEAARENISIRGCSLSHLQALRRHAGGRPLLVLEDDAEMIPEHYDEWLDAGPLPEDAGAVLLGGDITHHRESAEHPGWHEVTGIYWGTHAVAYNAPALSRKEFLTNAYALLAGNQMGPAGNGFGLCYESVLLMALRRCGLKLYCRARHAFTTRAELESTRSGTVMPPRARALAAAPVHAEQTI